MVSLIKGVARTFAGKEVISAGERSFTFGEFWAKLRAAGAVYRQWGLRPGDRVLLLLPNGPEFLFFHFGALQVGVVSVPIKTEWRRLELERVLDNCRPRLVIADKSWLEEHGRVFDRVDGEARVVSIDDSPLEPGTGDDRVLPVSSAALASIHYTYFGDGYPKGAALSHGNHIYAATGYARHQGFTADERFLIVLPMSHVYALSGCVNSGLLRGGSLVILNKLTPRSIFTTVQRQRITVISSVPPVYEQLARFRHKPRYDLSALRLCVTGGDFLPRHLQVQYQQALGKPIVQGYGLSECLPVICNPPDSRNKPGTLGIPGRRDIHCRIVRPDGTPAAPGERGEITVASPTTMIGYYGLPGETAKVLRDGWLHTGDLGYLDDDGFLNFCGMTKPVLNVYGNKVDPLEVRRALLEHPAVADATVYLATTGDPDRLVGTRDVAARVELRPGTELSESEFRAFLTPRIAAYKIPTQMEFKRPRLSIPRATVDSVTP